ncbi:Vi polysaccharide biosynthesis UDP-N-acetylglucosamine C-6 dehydrogenase TviB [Candidatus Pseudothioglobus sp. Uisw_050_01]|uniref:Vi polysaccharide biosynthesis UDP-N-acetylglucosamine C-6 dehydrogenase TviB n=1 Tax=Candidatus Pseudothioglobus sp. Uisw_050_01 TaxID=3230997 RepID=UPI003A86113A
MTEKSIAVIGLGYVGLPLSVEFGKKRHVIGFDINKNRLIDLKNGFDSTLEITSQELNEASYLSFTSKLDEIKACEIYIITVPTPIDSDKNPDLAPLKKASQSIGVILKKGDIVIYESTVYPGATEEVCVPLLEKYSGLKFNKDFYCGYSPERINPGDKNHRLADIKKVTSGSNKEVSIEIDILYREIIKAGTHMASSIKVAEAAKVIENTQRDVNIALINELSIIFNKLGIDTQSVLEAAATKWNFLPFTPGLVGGHCIGVDPYYLTHKALSIGYKPEVILAGRKINDSMGTYVVQEILKLMKEKAIKIPKSNILIMGLTFKDNCPDLRNSKVFGVIKEFENLNCNVDVYDPWASKEEVSNYYNINLIDKPVEKKYDCIVLAVAHNDFKSMSKDRIKEFSKDKFILYDIKHILNKEEVDGRL